MPRKRQNWQETDTNSCRRFASLLSPYRDPSRARPQFLVLLARPLHLLLNRNDWGGGSNFAIESAYAPCTIQTIRKSNERTNEQIRYSTKKDVLKNRFISNYFMLVYLVPQSRSPKLFFRCEISCKVWSCTHKNSFCRWLRITWLN